MSLTKEQIEQAASRKGKEIKVKETTTGTRIGYEHSNGVYYWFEDIGNRNDFSGFEKYSTNTGESHRGIMTQIRIAQRVKALAPK